ncbi:MAG TPA: HAD-IA family hydrolase [Gaiellaceae bacterium]|nr:HAD-IA family hydrolase [Gaiellaceae bacterium]
MSERWATFDCYGTLIDWNAGIRGALAGVFGENRADDLLARYHELEPELEHDGSRSYAEVMTEAMRRLGASEDDAASLAESLPSWDPFPEVRGVLAELRLREWWLAILSNSDPPQIEASKAKLGVPFDVTVVAGEIGSYKPAHRHWEEFYARSGAAPERHVHVGASVFHDAVPARELGIPFVWINRLGETSNVPVRELPDLTRLPATLDELVSA